MNNNEERIIKLLEDILEELQAARTVNARRILGDPFEVDGSAGTLRPDASKA